MHVGSLTFLALFLLGQAVPTATSPLNAPPPVKMALVAVVRPLSFAGECIELHPRLRLDEDYERLEQQFFAARNDAEGVWPEIEMADIETVAVAGGSPWSSCKREHVTDALRQAEERLDAYSVLFRQLTSKMDLRTVWIGPLQLCRESVESAEIVMADPQSKQPALLVKVSPRARTLLAQITEQAVGKQLPIRLDGTVIARPWVYERISGGELQIAGPDSEALTRLAGRVAEQC